MDAQPLDTADQPIEAFLPHRGAMLLLQRLLSADAERAVAEAVVPAHNLLMQEGRMPPWAGIEYMAQTIAAWSGARARARAEPARLGFLLGSRRYESFSDGFAAGARLRIEIAREFVSDAGLGMFDCRILVAGAEAASARVAVFEPVDGTAFLNSISDS